MRLRFPILLLALALSAGPARGVILAPGDGTGNTSAPADDPGWRNVGTQAGATAVYLGAGWVATANHVAMANPVFDGVAYPFVPGSVVQLQATDGTPADLKVYRVNPFPPLPSLDLYPGAPAVGADLVLIGRGRDRGAATSWSGHAGWLYGAAQTKRWGTNKVSASNLVILGTRAFEVNLSQSGATTHESQAATGDSGGAVFLKTGETWYLAGILFAIGPYEGQPNGTALYGNLSYAAQLSAYAGAILTLAATPVCSDGLDNDGDGLVDAPADAGCQNAYYMTENPACQNGLDDDGDGLTDLADPVCGGQPWYPTESAACGLGFEVGALLPLLAAVRRRLRSARRR